VYLKVKGLSTFLSTWLKLLQVLFSPLVVEVIASEDEAVDEEWYLQHVNSIFTWIREEDFIHRMPRSIRAITASVLEMAERYVPDRKYPLMAGASHQCMCPIFLSMLIRLLVLAPLQPLLVRPGLVWNGGRRFPNLCHCAPAHAAHIQGVMSNGPWLIMSDSLSLHRLCNTFRTTRSPKTTPSLPSGLKICSQQWSASWVRLYIMLCVLAAKVALTRHPPFRCGVQRRHFGSTLLGSARGL
jgi:hypothetical protein